MAEDSKIEWTTHTFNPWRGCSKVSPGCAGCYAETMSGRNPKTLGVWGPNGTRVVAAEAQWKLPLKWDREAKLAAELWEAIGGDTSRPGTMEHKGASCWWHRPRVFCASLADVFEDWQGPMVNADGLPLMKWHMAMDSTRWFDAGNETFQLTPDQCVAVAMSDVRARLFRLIDATPNLDWLLLTKRPENVARMMPWARRGETRMEPAQRKNIWLGTSVENQQAAEERIPHLLKVPAAVRFLSVEPLLGPVDLTRVDSKLQWPGRSETSKLNALYGYSSSRRNRFVHNGIVEEKGDIAFVDTEGASVDWVIVGGESGPGPGARLCRIEWIRDLVQQCKAAGVPVFVKQLGAFVDGLASGLRLTHLRDRKGGDMAEWPADLRVREMPAKR